MHPRSGEIATAVPASRRICDRSELAWLVQAVVRSGTDLVIDPAADWIKLGVRPPTTG